VLHPISRWLFHRF